VKYHPDVNKDPNAEAKFKEINEAWQVIESGRSSSREDEQWYSGNWSTGYAAPDFSNIWQDLFGFGQSGRRRNASDITIEETISFKESILGCIRNVKFSCDMKCSDCDGLGKKKISNGCTTCGGFGRVIQRSGMMVVNQTCPSCRGKVSQENCNKCSETGSIAAEVSLSINIPAGAKHGDLLTLGNRGNYIGGDEYTRLLLKISVIPQAGLSLQNNDVISSVDISLLEALQGCKKVVPTIDDNKEIIIPKQTKNKDEIILPNLGVARRGKQVVIINVNYPINNEELINFLQGQ
jgi:molecular chaperone DnaJ